MVLDQIAEEAYRSGVDPIDLAIYITSTNIANRDIMLRIRPGSKYEDDETVACKVVGDFLDLGWTPPARDAA